MQLTGGVLCIPPVFVVGVPPVVFSLQQGISWYHKKLCAQDVQHVVFYAPVRTFEEGLTRLGGDHPRKTNAMTTP
jgi:hypothetical protein